MTKHALHRDAERIGDRTDELMRDLLDAAHALGARVSLDHHVDEATAARLLNRAPGTLRNWRHQHRPLAFRRYGRRGRVSYSLVTLATFILQAEHDCTDLHDTARSDIAADPTPANALLPTKWRQRA